MPSEPVHKVRLSADGAFAVLEVTPANGLGLEEARALPGYFRAGAEVQVWLSPALRDLIVSQGLDAAPGVLAAIDAEVIKANTTRPWATELERASTCGDPDSYPPSLVERLRQLGMLGSPG